MFLGFLQTRDEARHVVTAFSPAICRRNRRFYGNVLILFILFILFDDELFGKAIRLSNHILHDLLPPPSIASQHYNLRRRTHSLQLPEHSTHLSDCNFFTRMLYKNTLATKITRGTLITVIKQTAYISYTYFLYFRLYFIFYTLLLSIMQCVACVLTCHVK